MMGFGPTPAPNAPSAPLSELRLGYDLRRYERVKLALLVIVLAINLAIGGYLVNLAQTNKTTLEKSSQALGILRCAVAKEVRAKPNGQPLTQKEAQAAFDVCIQRGHPLGP